MRSITTGPARTAHDFIKVSDMTFYDFDTIIDRRNTYSVKWSVAPNELPMWVADMDFQTAPEILETLKLRVEHGIFGYTEIPDAWAQAYAAWWSARHGVNLKRDRFIFCTGVVAAISSIVRKLTTPNENVVILTPVYPIFFNSIINNGCRVLESPLIYNGYDYRIDFDDLEKKLSDPQTRLMIWCNPHNPIGKIWDHATQARVCALCERHHVAVISDEIHCDITDPDKMYAPFSAISETARHISITCMAPTKTFNLAGLQTACVYVEDEDLHHRVWRALNTDEVAEPNAFAIQAAIAAYSHGAPWLDALRQYILKNKQTAVQYLKDHAPEVHIVPSEATYLLWLDCSKLTRDAKDFSAQIRKKTGLYLSSGTAFGGNGKYFLRWNIACPRAVLLDGLERFCHALSL